MFKKCFSGRRTRKPGKPHSLLGTFRLVFLVGAFVTGWNRGTVYQLCQKHTKQCTASAHGRWTRRMNSNPYKTRRRTQPKPALLNTEVSSGHFAKGTSFTPRKQLRQARSPTHLIPQGGFKGTMRLHFDRK